MLNLEMEISTRDINVNYYYPTLKKVAEEIKETGIIIKPDDITFNLNEVRGAGLSFITEYINIDTVLESYKRIGTKQAEEAEEIKNNKYYHYIEENYIFTITRDNYYDTDKTSVSCEYWDGNCSLIINTEREEIAEKIGKIINIVKNYICDYILHEVRKTDKEISDIMEDVILKIIGKPHYAGEREDGRPEFEAKAVDKSGNIYQVTWLSYEDWNIYTDDEKVACDWKEPFYIQLIEKR